VLTNLQPRTQICQGMRAAWQGLQGTASSVQGDDTQHCLLGASLGRATYFQAVAALILY
jgi:hypothetical protein